MRYNTSQCGWCGGLIPHYYGLLQYKLWQPEVGSPTCTSPAACPMLIRQKVSAIARWLLIMSLLFLFGSRSESTPGP
eukprot:2634599-Pyramimonas_sp.AAC.1